MARTPLPAPTYRHHKKTGRAIITVRDHQGARHDMLLPGPFASRESREEYERVCALLRANHGRLPPPAVAPADLTVTQLILRFMTEHVSTYYVHGDTGEPTREQLNFQSALRPLNRLFGD